MTFFSPPGYSEPDQGFLAILQGQVTSILSACGIKRTTDSEQIGRSSNPFASVFSFTNDDLEQLKTTGEWDDRPAIDKIIDLFMASAKRQHDCKPDTQVVRILGILPESCTVVIMIAISFTPSSERDMADLSAVGRWSIAMRDVGGITTGGPPRNWQGDVLDRQDLQDALDGLQTTCGRYRDQHRLKPLGGGIGTLSGFDPEAMMAKANQIMEAMREVGVPTSPSAMVGNATPEIHETIDGPQG